MSVCRFSEGDVYVLYDVHGGITCCGCRLTSERRILNLPDEGAMIAHLKKHPAAGHRVPEDAFYRLFHPEEWADPAD